MVCSYAWILTLSLLYWARKSTTADHSAGSCNSWEPQLADTPPAGPQLEQKLLHRSRQLPSWVLFPDVERAEWMNVILRKVWPNFGEIARQIAKRLVEPKIKVCFPPDWRICVLPHRYLDVVFD
jgi:hypothetical protein